LDGSKQKALKLRFLGLYSMFVFNKLPFINGLSKIANLYKNLKNSKLLAVDRLFRQSEGSFPRKASFDCYLISVMSKGVLWYTK